MTRTEAREYSAGRNVSPWPALKLKVNSTLNPGRRKHIVRVATWCSSGGKTWESLALSGPLLVECWFSFSNVWCQVTNIFLCQESSSIWRIPHVKFLEDNHSAMKKLQIRIERIFVKYFNSQYKCWKKVFVRILYLSSLWGNYHHEQNQLKSFSSSAWNLCYRSKKNELFPFA